jgi:mRNA interferase MazF
MRRGEVYWATLSPRSVSEQAGRRPVVVVSRDAFNQAPGWRSIIVVPISTSPAQSRRGPTAVALPTGAGGIAQESVTLCHQVTTLDRGKRGELLGSLRASQLRERTQDSTWLTVGRCTVAATHIHHPTNAYTVGDDLTPAL